MGFFPAIFKLSAMAASRSIVCLSLHHLHVVCSKSEHSSAFSARSRSSLSCQALNDALADGKILLRNQSNGVFCDHGQNIGRRILANGKICLRYQSNGVFCDHSQRRGRRFLAVGKISLRNKSNGVFCDHRQRRGRRILATSLLAHETVASPEASRVFEASDACSEGGALIEEDDTAMMPGSERALCETTCVTEEASTSGSEFDESVGFMGRDGSRMRWGMLLSTGVLQEAHLSRAGSVTDAHVLRRKGRLKEQDGLIEFIISMHTTHSPFQVMEKMERWILEHFENPRRSTLRRLVPSVGRFYTPLPLSRSLEEYDEFAFLSRRKYVPPNFAEIRHILNISQVHAIAESLSLLTFDADGTLYADGHHMERDNKMIAHIVKFMQQNIHIAIVTAAGYPGDTLKFEHRVAGLLAAFRDLHLPSGTMRYFHVMGGECNYLLKVDDNYRLQFVPDELWKSTEMLGWLEEDVQTLLDDAELALRSAAARLKLEIDVIRKARSVGAIPKAPTIYEVLEEMALTVQVQLVDATLPFCAFNGGNDVFVDVGNKSIGLGALMNYLGKKADETLHVGDRFTLSGNDSATRSKCPILWVANPEETGFFMRLLLNDIQVARLTPYLE